MSNKKINLGIEPRILVVRPDNIGDVLLTTPAVKALRKMYPKAFIGYLCQKYTSPLLLDNPAISQIINVDDFSFFGLINKIRDMKFDAAIHFYVDSRAVWTTFLSNIPVRIGPFSKMTSVLLNHRLTQNRSQVAKHEAEYNMDLLEILGAEVQSETPEIYLSKEEKWRGEKIVIAAKLNTKKPLVVIHPGSKGSAENWPLDHFIKLAQKIANTDCNVLFTAGNGEEHIIEKINIKLGNEHTHIRTYPAGRLSLRELASVINYSKLMVSNSTGPLHMAVSLGTPTVSFFPSSPVVTSKKRWGPFGSEDKNLVLTPHNGHQAVSSISLDTAFSAVKKILN